MNHPDKWEISVLLFRWGALDELEASYARAGERMHWSGKPQVLLGRRTEEPGAGAWAPPLVCELTEAGVYESTVYALLRSTGIPLNPDRLVESHAETLDGTRYVDFAVCLSLDESTALKGVRAGPSIERYAAQTGPLRSMSCPRHELREDPDG